MEHTRGQINSMQHRKGGKGETMINDVLNKLSGPTKGDKCLAVMRECRVMFIH